MTRKSLVTQAELKRMAEIANAENVTVEVEREGTVIRVMPFHKPQQISQKLSREEEGEAALKKWQAERAAKRGSP